MNGSSEDKFSNPGLVGSFYKQLQNIESIMAPTIRSTSLSKPPISSKYNSFQVETSARLGIIPYLSKSPQTTRGWLFPLAALQVA
jgi:hypothetical protein